MPRPHEHRAVQVLVPLWLILLTFSQVGLFIYLFKAQHCSQCEIPTNGKYPMEPMSTYANLPPSEKSKILNFEAKEGNVSTIEWMNSDPDSRPIAAEKDHLSIKQDGYYCLCLQVTLKSHQAVETTVRITSYVNHTRANKTLVEAKISEKALSTGISIKAEKLSANTKLKVTIDPQATINPSDSATYLDVIFINVP